MLNTGAEPMPSKRGLLTTVAYQLKGQPPVCVYTIFVSYAYFRSRVCGERFDGTLMKL
jgi:glycerol kinase